MTTNEIRITRRGMVVVGGVTYYAEPLTFLSGSKVQVRIDRDDTNKAYVFRQDGVQICVVEAVEKGGK